MTYPKPAHPTLKLHLPLKRATRQHPQLGELTLFNMDGGMLAWYTHLDIQEGNTIRFGIWAEKQGIHGEESFFESGAKYLAWSREHIKELMSAAFQASSSADDASQLESFNQLSAQEKEAAFTLASILYHPLDQSAEWHFTGTGPFRGFHISFDHAKVGEFAGTSRFCESWLEVRIEHILEGPEPLNLPVTDYPWDQIMWTHMRNGGYLGGDAKLAELVDFCIAQARQFVKNQTGTVRAYYDEQAGILEEIRDKFILSE